MIIKIFNNKLFKISIYLVLILLTSVFISCEDECEHFFDEWHITQEAKCEVKGLEKRVCLYCAYEETREVKALEHKKVTVEGFPSTCLQTGLTDGVSCERCEKVFEKQEVIPTLQHNTEGVEWEIDYYPDFAEEGRKSIKCKVCRERVQTESIPKLYYTPGLIYELNATKDGYIITGKVTSSTIKVVIYATLQGLPIVEITADFSESIPEEVYFEGTKEQWNKIIMKNANNHPEMNAIRFFINGSEAL